MMSSESANGSKLNPVSEESLAAFRSRREDIVAETTRQSLYIGKGIALNEAESEKMIAAGLDFTTQALETAMQFSDTTLLANQISWAAERLPHDGVMPVHVLDRFEILTEVISKLLPEPHAQAVNQYVRWMIAEQRRRMAQDG